VMPRPSVDQDHSELTKVLEALLTEDVTISANAVARRHSTLQSTTAITRSPARMTLLRDFQARQQRARELLEKAGSAATTRMARALAAREAEVATLRRQVTALVEGHVALVRVVAEMGGVRQLTKFYENYREVREQLGELAALPDSPDPTPRSSS
ncbi:MAG: hypothetical protein AAB092_08355, partial [Chloroflexota bacterium]